MESNQNFSNEYELIILNPFRTNVIKFLTAIEKNWPNEWELAKFKMQLNGENIQLTVNNMSVFNSTLKKDILKFLTQFQKYHV